MPRRPKMTERDVMIARHMRALRLERGITLEQLSARTDVTAAQLSNAELARDRIPAGRLWMVADALGVAPGAMFPVDDQDVVPFVRHQRAVVELVRQVSRMTSEDVQALLTVARAMAERGGRS